MYCKNCGRQLKEGMRFCDRCGQSVRKSKESSQAARHREIEELKAERLNRKKRLAEKEAKQARNKQRKKKKGGSFVFVFALVVMLIAAVSVIIGYNIFPDNTNKTNAAKETASPLNNNISASSAPLSTAVPTSSASLKDGYSEIKVGNITCPYPSSFHANTMSTAASSGTEKLNITDSLGGASMTVIQEAKTGEPKDLMKEYITQIGADDNPVMRGGSDWYSVTATVNGKVYHRKCIVRNGLLVYYDFTYDASSSALKKYEEYISYIDSEFA